MIFAFLFSHITVWWFASEKARKSEDKLVKSAWSALGPAVVFSPSIIVGGHGFLPFPAIASILLQPFEGLHYKILSFMITYSVFFCCFLFIKRKG